MAMKQLSFRTMIHELSDNFSFCSPGTFIDLLYYMRSQDFLSSSTFLDWRLFIEKIPTSIFKDVGCPEWVLVSFNKVICLIKLFPFTKKTVKSGHKPRIV